MAKSKICTKCGKRKLLSAFHRARKGKYGRRAICKRCVKKYSKARKVYDKKYYKANKIRIDKRNKNYRQVHKAKITMIDKKYQKTLIGYIRHLFHQMKQRCNNPKNLRYHRYGGRGIKVKFNSSQELVDYVIDILKIDPRGLTVDRIDNDGHYKKGNIRFVTVKENCNNRKRKR